MNQLPIICISYSPSTLFSSPGKRVGVVGVDKLSYTVKDLPHSTSIPIQVAPVTAAGEGENSVPIMCSTLNLSEFYLRFHDLGKC